MVRLVLQHQGRRAHDEGVGIGGERGVGLEGIVDAVTVQSAEVLMHTGLHGERLEVWLVVAA